MQPDKIDLLVYYLHERERIRLKKEAGEPRPWTKDKILHTFKFTNVLRSNDYTTKWLVQNWYQPNREAPLDIQLINCGIARYFGHTDFLGVLGFQKDWDPQRIKETAARHSAQGRTVFTGAYIITNGGLSGKKWDVVVDNYLSALWKNRQYIVNVARNTHRWEKATEALNRLPGFGGSGFMAKEVMQDVMLTPILFDAVDRNTWTAVGPGSKRGMNRILGRDAKAALRPEELLKQIRLLFDEVGPRLESWMPKWKEEFDLHCIQFALCELDKYLRVTNGEGKMKSSYTPRRR